MLHDQKVKRKTFKGLSIVKNCVRPESPPLRNMLDWPTNKLKDRHTTVILQGLLIRGVQYTKLDHICLLNILLVHKEIGCAPHERLCSIMSFNLDFFQFHYEICTFSSFEDTWITSSSLQRKYHAPIIRHHYDY